MAVAEADSGATRMPIDDGGITGPAFFDLAAVKALTDDRGGLTFDIGIAWLPADDPCRP